MFRILAEIQPLLSYHATSCVSTEASALVGFRPVVLLSRFWLCVSSLADPDDKITAGV